jgi:hypothetical protein
MNLILKGKDVELLSLNCEIKTKDMYGDPEFLYVDARFYDVLPHIGYHDNVDTQIEELKHQLELVTEIGFSKGFDGSYSCYKNNLSLGCITDETILILEGVLYLCMNLVFVRKDQ